MNDSNTTIETLKNRMKAFVEERDWQQFHTPKNLAMALGMDAGKLLEKFLFVDSPKSIPYFEKNREAVIEDLGRLTSFLMSFCALYDIDLSQAFDQSMKTFKERYTPEKSKEITKLFTDL